jgi:hypothetical protein
MVIRIGLGCLLITILVTKALGQATVTTTGSPSGNRWANNSAARQWMSICDLPYVNVGAIQ